MACSTCNHSSRSAHTRTHSPDCCLRVLPFYLSCVFVLMQRTHGHARNALFTVAGIKCNTRTHSHRINEEETLYARCKLCQWWQQNENRWRVAAAVDSLFHYFIIASTMHVFQCWFSIALPQWLSACAGVRAVSAINEKEKKWRRRWWWEISIIANVHARTDNACIQFV